MKIGIYSPYLDTLSGGEKYMLLAASFLSTFAEVEVFWDDSLILTKAEEKLGIDLKRVKVVKNIFTSETSLINRLFLTKKYDYIFALSDGSLPLVSSKLIVHFQFPIKNKKLDMLDKVKLKRISEIICNSNFTKQFIDKEFNVDSKVIYPPTFFTKDLIKVDLKEKENIVLNIGRYERLENNSSFKKQEFLIATFKKMVDKGFKGWKLHLVISYFSKDKLHIDEIKKSIKDYPIEILENVTNEKLQEEYAKAKIYWHASGYGEDLNINPERAEHFGITTVEAMANGAVPIVVGVGGQVEIVEDGISGFLWLDEEELMLKTILLSEDNGKFIEMSTAAQQRSKLFTSDIFCEKIKKVFINE